MSSYRRSPRGLEHALESLQSQLAPASLLGEVQRVWSRAVGAGIAAEAAPVSERGGVLTVACSASVWAQELDLMAPQLLARLNELLASGSISRLRCTTLPR